MTGKRGSGTGPRPHTWLAGPDPLRHEQYKSWLQKRNQAQWRGETWQLTFDDFCEIWGTQWSRAGRWRDCLQMMRRDFDQPWSRANVDIVDRDQFHQRQAQRRQQLRERAQHAAT